MSRVSGSSELGSYGGTEGIGALGLSGVRGVGCYGISVLERWRGGGGAWLSGVRLLVS